MNLTWRDLLKEEEYYKIPFGPKYFPTDFGSCCMLIPQLDFEKLDRNITSEQILKRRFGIKSITKSGEINGLEILLDAEQFNYAFYSANSAGFRQSCLRGVGYDGDFICW